MKRGLLPPAVVCGTGEGCRWSAGRGSGTAPAPPANYPEPSVLPVVGSGRAGIRGHKGGEKEEDNDSGQHSVVVVGLWETEDRKFFWAKGNAQFCLFCGAEAELAGGA